MISRTIKHSTFARKKKCPSVPTTVGKLKISIEKNKEKKEKEGK